jgi:hypothetical protein
MAARPQGSVDGAQGRGPLGIVEEHLRHVAGHNQQIGLWSPQSVGIALDPLHLIGAWLLAGNR